MLMSFNISRMKSFRVDNHCRQRGFMVGGTFTFTWRRDGTLRCHFLVASPRPFGTCHSTPEAATSIADHRNFALPLRDLRET